jgi:hypothetical protein
MDANDARDMMEPEADDRFKKRAAVTIAVMAMLLAITGLGGSNAGKDMTNNNIQASNLYAFYQAKYARQVSFQLAANDLELALVRDPTMPPEAKAAIEKRIREYRDTAVRYESDPKEKDGKKEILAQAREAEAARDVAARRDPYFDYAEALLQIAIVLSSVAIIATSAPLLLIGNVLGGIATLLMLNGYLLLVRVPMLG